jgi:hypothetical protein
VLDVRRGGSQQPSADSRESGRGKWTWRVLLTLHQNGRWPKTNFKSGHKAMEVDQEEETKALCTQQRTTWAAKLWATTTQGGSKAQQNEEETKTGEMIVDNDWSSASRLGHVQDHRDLDVSMQECK